MKYATPEIELRALMAKDIITSSNDEDEEDDDTTLPDVVLP